MSPTLLLPPSQRTCYCCRHYNRTAPHHHGRRPTVTYTAAIVAVNWRVIHKAAALMPSLPTTSKTGVQRTPNPKWTRTAIGIALNVAVPAVRVLDRPHPLLPQLYSVDKWMKSTRSVASFRKFLAGLTAFQVPGRHHERSYGPHPRGLVHHLRNGNTIPRVTGNVLEYSRIKTLINTIHDALKEKAVEIKAPALDGFHELESIFCRCAEFTRRFPTAVDRVMVFETSVHLMIAACLHREELIALKVRLWLPSLLCAYLILY
ncbi:hypothetical protein BCR44DRAFT_1135859 [Catenaria anguillulae PL171]|uniref:Uncharacterized protein n=1 Tax=Catenaria anguillulae PL171 TaxID=765915 RepID=A0A1Y2H406_9FUNG|nr:hypothetical protein BCR44DRAFT_1135859 [Catenaria anguillulae PL171]